MTWPANTSGSVSGKVRRGKEGLLFNLIIKHEAQDVKEARHLITVE